MHIHIPAMAAGNPMPIPTPRAILSLNARPEGVTGTSSGIAVVKTEVSPFGPVVVPI